MDTLGIMNNLIATLDLGRQAPLSPRERIGGFVIAGRAVDKCLASAAGTPGEYRFNCPLDNLLFSFKGITAEQFTAAARSAKKYADIGEWLQANGKPKTPAEISAWSDDMESASPLKNPEKRTYFVQNCRHLGMDPETTSTFDLLEADDGATFSRESV